MRLKRDAFRDVNTALLGRPDETRHVPEDKHAALQLDVGNVARSGLEYYSSRHWGLNPYWIHLLQTALLLGCLLSKNASSSIRNMFLGFHNTNFVYEARGDRSS